MVYSKGAYTVTCTLPKSLPVTTVVYDTHTSISVIIVFRKTCLDWGPEWSSWIIRGKAVGDDYLIPAVRAKCERIIPQVETVLPNKLSDAYLFVKVHYIPPK